MMGNKICLFGEIWKIISKLYLLLILIWNTEFYCNSAITDDHSRIVLKRGETDYINASLIQVPESNRRYILSQVFISVFSGINSGQQT